MVFFAASQSEGPICDNAEARRLTQTSGGG